MVRYDRVPLISLEERKKLLKEIAGVSKVVVQHEVSYQGILEELRPDYVIHGDDWQKGPMCTVRQNVIDTLAKWGGELIEIPYTQNENS